MMEKDEKQEETKDQPVKVWSDGSDPDKLWPGDENVDNLWQGDV